MKEIVLVTLAMDTETGEIDPEAPFMVNSQRSGPRYNRPMKTSRASSGNSARARVRFGSKPSGMTSEGIGFSASAWTMPDS
jgi:hypothetical protein